MTLEEMRKRLLEIQSSLDTFTGIENYTEENITDINALNDEFSTLKNNVEAKEALENMQTNMQASQRKVAPKAPAAPGRPKVGEPLNKGNAGFESRGEFYMAVKNASLGGQMDERLQNTMVEKRGEDGGFLIPDDFRSEIQEKVTGDQSLLSLTDSYNTSSNRLSLPTSETAPWDSSGGIQAYWEGEAKQFRESQEEFKMVDYKLHKLTAYVKVSEELLGDAPALESFIKRKAPEAMLHKINSGIISGSGAGMPRGFLESGFGVSVLKEAAQVADTVNYKNLIKMESRLMGDGVWIANAGVREQLRLLKDDNGNLIFLNGMNFPNMSAQPFDMLLGKRIIFMMGSVPALGDKGDISLVNLSQYTTVVKTAGIRQEVSTHVHFDQDLTAFKFAFRVAGDCPYQAPVTTEFGNYQMSGIVTLDERA